MKFKDQRPLIDAFAASNSADPAGVRRALRPWVTRAASSAVAKEREAELQYRLYRAGDAGALDKLKALDAANPNSHDITLYLRLALQPHDELWS